MVFGDQVCRDCGQRGDERLLSDLCHERKVEKERNLLMMADKEEGKAAPSFQ